MLIARYYPKGLIGLGVTALLAGFMAGQAGNISAFNTVWTYDIYKSVINKKASDAHYVWMGRMATVVGILLSLGHRLLGKDRRPPLWTICKRSFPGSMRRSLRPCLLGMFVVWITPNGAFWGFMAGMTSSITMFLAVKFNWISPPTCSPCRQRPSDMSANFWRAWWAWLICFAVTIVVSLFTKAKPREELIGLVKGLTPVAGADGLRWYRKPELIAAISLIVLILLNLYFW